MQRFADVAGPDTTLRDLAHFTGFLAYALVLATVAFGVLTTTGLARASLRRDTIYGAHMVLSIAALSFSGLHAMAHLFKVSGAYTPVQELVPFATPLPVTLGAVGFELMVVAAASVWLQRRIGYRRWLSIHRTAHVGFVLVVAHVVVTGHDHLRGMIGSAFVATLIALAALLAVRAAPVTSTRILRPVEP